MYAGFRPSPVATHPGLVNLELLSQGIIGNHGSSYPQDPPTGGLPPRGQVLFPQRGGGWLFSESYSELIGEPGLGILKFKISISENQHISKPFPFQKKTKKMHVPNIDPRAHGVL